MKKKLSEFCRLVLVVPAVAALAVMLSPPVLAQIGENATLGDRVWVDLDEDGVQDCQDTNNNGIIGDVDPNAPNDPNESDQGPECATGVGDITVNLYTKDVDRCRARQELFQDTTTTDDMGFYKFTRTMNLPETLCVQFVPPPNCKFTLRNVGDDMLDSDANTFNGLSNAARLKNGDNNTTVDAGLICEEPETAMLGDRVWEDKNANGKQNCQDSNGDGIIGNAGDSGFECNSGIPNVPVMLTLPGLDSICNTGDDVGTGMQQLTDSKGFYKFTVKPGEYCVMFGKPARNFCQKNGFDLGDPQFTAQDVGNDARDSDADPNTGKTGNITLKAGDDDRTIDAGIYCPAKLGNRVWEDSNENGIQDAGEAGVGGIAVKLFECGPDGVAGTADDIDTGETRITDGNANGKYMFGAEADFDLAPGKYYVKFKKPFDREFTIPNVNGDGKNSDCLPPDGITACTMLNSGAINLRRDCGLVPPPPVNCDLALDKKCRVEPKPTASFDKCDGKLQQFTVLWDGAGDIVVNGLGKSNLAVSPGDEVTFFGPFSDNDVEISLSGAANGTSVFHMSCSDDDFNDPTDCGKLAGNAKNDSGFVNEWRLEGFIDNQNRVLDCNPPSDGEFTDSCEFTQSSVPSCDTISNPETLTWRYDGGTNGDGDCASSTFLSAVNDDGDPHKDFVCTGNVDVTQPITVDPYKGDNVFISPGDEFTTVLDGSKKLLLFNSSGGGGEQYIELHTSCSQPIAAGLTAGALTLVAVDGQRASTKVTYQYEVINNGDSVFGIGLMDDRLGDIAGPFDLGNGDSVTFEKSADIEETTVNTAVASGKLASGDLCQAEDNVVVTVNKPPVPPAPISCDDIKNITSVELIWNGAGPIDILSETGQSITGINTGDAISLLTESNDTDVSISGAVNGMSTFHVSCSDNEMDGNEDCGKPQGNGKSDDLNLLNDWLLDGMTGEKGQFSCP